MGKQKSEMAKEPNGETLNLFKAQALTEEELSHLKGGDGTENPPPPEEENLIGHEDLVDL